MLYRHKNGNIYRARTRRVARAPLYAGERLVVDLSDGDGSAHITDDIQMGEEFVVYTSVTEATAHYARPARLFDEPARFTRIPTPEVPDHA